MYDKFPEEVRNLKIFITDCPRPIKVAFIMEQCIRTVGMWSWDTSYLLFCVYEDNVRKNGEQLGFLRLTFENI
jgi:hypothetical protein